VLHKNEFFEIIHTNKQMDSIQNNETMTSFMGVTLSKEGSVDPRITKALNSSGSLLDILKFIEVTEFDLNKVMFDYFWQVMIGNTPIHLGRCVLEWFGYEGEIFSQKQKFVSMLKRNNITYKELTQHDKEIELYPTIAEEISLLPSNVRHSKFLIMEPKDIKMAIMQLKTKNGHIIRQYYIDLEDLMKLYVEYTLAFNERRALYKIESLEKMMEDMRLCNERQEKILAEVRDQNENLKESLFEVRDQNEISMTS
jgi:MSV199 domain